MKLELKHLAPYLPYGLKGSSDKDYVNGHGFQSVDVVGLSPERVSIDKDKVIATLLYTYNDFKPILRPLSDLDTFLMKQGYPLDECNWHEEVDGFYLGIPYEMGVNFEHYQVIFEHHFDVFGLIEKGLAIDINTLEV